MKKTILMLLVSVLFISCTTKRDVNIIRTGILQQGIAMKAFLVAWGPPDRTGVVEININNPGISASWNQYGGRIKKGSSTRFYQEWIYEKFGVSLLFDNQEDLISWKTDKTVNELKAISK